MSELHDRVIVALANTPGKQRTVAEITRYVNDHFIRSPYSANEVSSALMDLRYEKAVTNNNKGRWSIADHRKKGSQEYGTRYSRKEPVVKRVNRA